MLTDTQLQDLERDGFVIVENLFSAEEADLLLKIASADASMEGPAVHPSEVLKMRRASAQVVSAGDGAGRQTRFWVDDNVGEDYYSAIARSRRIVDAMEQVLDGEVYHWHHKMMLKSARTGGAFMWHQDFGYWHETGYCLFPYMGSCMIAVNRTTKENGCLQALAGSHHMGLIRHERVEGQAKADPERVAAAAERLPLVHLEMEPGTGAFFHANLLHRSDANESDDPRWTLICCYNAARNDPYRDSHHPRYTPLEKLDDDEIVRIGRAQWDGMGQ
ncbi:MAG: phytanoyl-CoA dioxygenase family protein [Phycisphaeraceae bacterium]|nr:phytanoyl-CoA dioxygenase family protein [Phycisphaeraceae bacterium]